MRITLHNYKRPGMVAYRWQYPGYAPRADWEDITHLSRYNNTIVYISEESVLAVGGSYWNYSEHTAVFFDGHTENVYGDELEAISA
jgi:hypothetical protein